MQCMLDNPAKWEGRANESRPNFRKSSIRHFIFFSLLRIYVYNPAIFFIYIYIDIVIECRLAVQFNDNYWPTCREPSMLVISRSGRKYQIGAVPQLIARSGDKQL